MHRLELDDVWSLDVFMYASRWVAKGWQRGTGKWVVGRRTSYFLTYSRGVSTPARICIHCLIEYDDVCVLCARPPRFIFLY